MPRKLKHIALSDRAHSQLNTAQTAMESELRRRVTHSETLERLYAAWAAAQPQPQQASR